MARDVGHIQVSPILGEVINLISRLLLMKSLTVNMVVGWNGQNMVRYVLREEGVRRMG
jgi:hypothetical protein